MLGIFMTGAVDISGESRVLLDALNHAGGDRVGGEGEDLADAILVAHREVKPKDAAVAPADDVGLWDLQHIHERDDIVGHEVIAVRARIASAAAVTATVHQDHGMMRRDGWNLVAPIVGIGEAAVQENHRRTLAVNRVVDLDAIGFGFAATVRGDRRRGRRQVLPSLSGERRQRYAGEEGSEGELAHGASPGTDRGWVSFSPFMLSCKRSRRGDERRE